MEHIAPPKTKKIKPKDFEKTMFTIIVCTDGPQPTEEETAKNLFKSFGKETYQSRRPLTVFEVTLRGELLRMWYMRGSTDREGCDLHTLEHDCKMGRKLFKLNKEQVDAAVRVALDAMAGTSDTVH